ncbi:MAG: alpha/beta fold hydrolase [Achromobacter sp.]|uniref:alpha/beta fold hydrolase n=1 Tax=Achromobacter sp. TaxID=134375 RepID=UPI003D00592E
MLLHGLNNTPAIWDAVIARLPGERPVLAPALPPLPDVDAIAQELLKTLPARFWLAGFSFGGYVAMALLERAPERVRGLALIGTTPQADTPAQSRARRDAVLALAAGGAAMEQAYVARTLAQGTAAFHVEHRDDEPLQRQRREMVEAYGARCFVAHALACLARPDRSGLLRAPLNLLWIAGSDDPIYPPQVMSAMRAQAATGTLRVLGPAGHLIPLEQPDALARLLAGWMLD